VWFEQVLFFLAGIGALAGALGVVILRNPFYSVLALVAHLVALAVLFLLLHGALHLRGGIHRRVRRAAPS
jgi:NADH:ubiquinone oxidoreductase subunit 6 (subunit J)